MQPSHEVSDAPPRPRNRRRWVLRVFLALLLIGISVLIRDGFVPPARQVSTRVAVSGIRFYQRVISPALGPIVTCRFKPTCSNYGLRSVQKYGAIRGGLRTIGRIFRCGPWTKMGTVDEP